MSNLIPDPFEHIWCDKDGIAGEANDVWLIKNWITGKDVRLPKSEYDEPTQAWIEGWNAAMQGDVCNPYPNDNQPEHAQWDDGWWSAMAD